MLSENSRGDFIRYLKTGELSPKQRSMIKDSVRVSNELVALLEKQAHTWPVSKMATVFRTGYGEAHKVAVTTSDPVLSWIAEGGAVPSGDPVLSGGRLELMKLSGIVFASEELLLDSGADVEQLIASSLGHTLAAELEQAYINGTGAAQPRGFLLDADSVEAEGTAVSYSDLVNLYKKLPEVYASTAVWLVNRDTMALLMGMSNNGEPVLAVGASGAASLLGKPVYITFMPNSSPVAFGDFSRYAIVQTVPTIQRLSSLKADLGLAGFVLKQRLNGRLFDTCAVAVLSIGG